MTETTTTVRRCGNTRPSGKQRGLMHALVAKAVTVPPEISDRNARADYLRGQVLDGFVPALGWAPLESHTQIDRDLCSALIDVLQYVEGGEVAYRGGVFAWITTGERYDATEGLDGAF